MTPKTEEIVEFKNDLPVKVPVGHGEWEFILFIQIKSKLWDTK